MKVVTVNRNMTAIVHLGLLKFAYTGPFFLEMVQRIRGNQLKRNDAEHSAHGHTRFELLMEGNFNHYLVNL